MASSAIAGTWYEPETETLTIEFNQRGTYEYYGVDPAEAAAFESAASLGGYFNAFIKDRYGYSRVG